MTVLDRIFDRLGFNGPVRGDDRELWASANTLADLGELTAQWLEGRIQSQPGYYGPVDVDEDDAPGITDTLVALNRAGFITDSSQAGFIGAGHDGAEWAQRAAVSGYADDATMRWLCASMRQAGFGTSIRALRRRFSRFPIGDGVTVTTRAGAPYTAFGRALAGRDIDFLYEPCGDAARDALKAAWQVVVYDPEWGPNDLWTALADAAARKVA